jgi:hypothetical protein
MSEAEGVEVCDQCRKPLVEGHGQMVGARMLCPDCCQSMLSSFADRASAWLLALGAVAGVIGSLISIFEGTNNSLAATHGLLIGLFFVSFAGVVRLGRILDALHKRN